MGFPCTNRHCPGEHRLTLGCGSAVANFQPQLLPSLRRCRPAILRRRMGSLSLLDPAARRSVATYLTARLRRVYPSILYFTMSHAPESDEFSATGVTHIALTDLNPA